MRYIYELTHFFEDENGYDIVTNIAVYSSRNKTNCAKERLKLNPKFSSHQDSFCIDRYELDKRGWKEGFN